MVLYYVNSGVLDSCPGYYIVYTPCAHLTLIKNKNETHVGDHCATSIMSGGLCIFCALRLSEPHILLWFCTVWTTGFIKPRMTFCHIHLFLKEPNLDYCWNDLLLNECILKDRKCATTTTLDWMIAMFNVSPDITSSNNLPHWLSLCCKPTRLNRLNTPQYKVLSRTKNILETFDFCISFCSSQYEICLYLMLIKRQQIDQYHLKTT